MDKNKEYFEKLVEKRKALSSHLTDPAAVGFWKMVVDKYSEKAHFVYELLQNADDAQASYARMLLDADGFYFIHNGKIPFNITDPDEEGGQTPIGHLNSITSIGSSSKKDNSSIGKFGIGFKSVFQYTNKPHVEDDVFCFTLEDYIVPCYAKRIKEIRENGETLFYFPFTDKEIAVKEITETVNNLNNPLLFLQSLRCLNFRSCINDEKREWKIGVLESNKYLASGGEKIKHQLLSISLNGKEEHKLHLFETSVECKNKSDLTCAVAFGCDDDAMVMPLQSENNCFCYFKLEERLDVPFLVHAPFMLTENRELIKKNDEWNDYLFQKLASLSVSIFFLQSKGCLKLSSNSPFDYLPLGINYCGAKETLFLDAFDELAKHYSIIKAEDETYVTARETLYSSDRKLRSIFCDYEIGLLNNEWNGGKWTFSCLDKCNAGSREIYLRFLLKNGLINRQIEIQDVLLYVDSDFLRSKNDEWLIDYYELLSLHKSLFSDVIFRKRILIKCKDGIFRHLDNEKGLIQLYINPVSMLGKSRSLFYVDCLYSNSRLATFCSLAGLSSPSELTYIEKELVPKYENEEVDRSDIDQLVEDITRIATYFSLLGYNTTEKERVLFLLSTVSFVPVVDCNGGKSFSCSRNVYFYCEELCSFFSSKKSLLYLDQDIIFKAQVTDREKIYYLLQSLGVSFSPRIVELSFCPDASQCAEYGLFPKSLRAQDNGGQMFLDKKIDGFNEMMVSWSASASVSFFKLLGKMIGDSGAYSFRKSLYGRYTYYEKRRQKPTEETVLMTTAYRQLFHMPWLANAEGKRVCVKEIKDSAYLLDDYVDTDANRYVLQFLGIDIDESLRGLSGNQKKEMFLLKKLKENGITNEDLQSLIDGRSRIVYNE